MATAYHLAIYNFGIHVDRSDSPAVRGFNLREPLNFAAAERAPGFVGRSGYEGIPGRRSWGPLVFPRLLEARGGDAVSSLSLWTDIESLMAFSYTGVHAEAMKHARNWNQVQEWPALVLFWVPAGDRPSWESAVERFERLADRGAGPEAFTFKQPYDFEGNTVEIDRTRVKALAAQNLALQTELLKAVAQLPV